MVVVAALQTLLHRYTAQDDIVVACATTGRNCVETDNLIGCFSNTLVLRTSFSGNPTFRQLLGRVRDVAEGAYANQELPFEYLVDELKLRPTRIRQRLLQVMLRLSNASLENLVLPGVACCVALLDAGPARFDLNMNLVESPDTLSGTLEYDSDRFEAATIRRLTERFHTLLERFAHENGETSLSDLWSIEKAQLPAHKALEHDSPRAAPLSYHQERLWFIERFEAGHVYPGSPVYHNLPLVLRFRGSVDATVLEEGINRLVARHAVLRTQIVTEGDVPAQVIRPSVQIRLTTVDLAGPEGGADPDRMAAHIADEANQPFDLSRDCLCVARSFW